MEDRKVRTKATWLLFRTLACNISPPFSFVLFTFYFFSNIFSEMKGELSVLHLTD